MLNVLHTQLIFSSHLYVEGFQEKGFSLGLDITISVVAGEMDHPLTISTLLQQHRIKSLLKDNIISHEVVILPCRLNEKVVRVGRASMTSTSLSYLMSISLHDNLLSTQPYIIKPLAYQPRCMTTSSYYQTLCRQPPFMTTCYSTSLYQLSTPLLV